MTLIATHRASDGVILTRPIASDEMRRIKEHIDEKKRQALKISGNGHRKTSLGIDPDLTLEPGALCTAILGVFSDRSGQECGRICPDRSGRCGIHKRRRNGN